MGLPKRYESQAVEQEICELWERTGAYRFDLDSDSPVYSIDTPPPYVSGHLHVGHVYSYSHTDFIARFRRMRGDNVFYPMGFDNNGLPTERMVERRLGINPAEVGRTAFIKKCEEVSGQLALSYRNLWRRLGLSVDWRYTYQTIDDLSRRTAQTSFIDLFRRGLAYRREAPVTWCPECRTAIAQADVNDLERESEFVTLPMGRSAGDALPIATTRPELLPACVAVLVHPDDARYRQMVGEEVQVPLFGQRVPVLADPGAQPEKGTGAVMCCTFGDAKDIEWWYAHALPLRVVIGRDGRFTTDAGQLAGETVPQARRRVIEQLEGQGQILDRRPVAQTVGVHERCDTPIEYIVTHQWFIRLLEHKDMLLAAGDRVRWYPEHMKARYREWVENLRWDWLISRQRFYGVPFPVWYCECGEVLVADESSLPVEPTSRPPATSCNCGSDSYTPEVDVMDTWATSSLTPQIVGGWLTEPALYNRVFPMSLRPQAHDIIRTWAFYTITQSEYHFHQCPWHDVMISGWGLAPHGSGKISKSRGGGPTSPQAVIDQYSADAVRYWAASTGLGKDAVIDEEKMRAGAKLTTKLWNVAVFSERFLSGYTPPADPPSLSPADRWILSSLQHVVDRSTRALEEYDYLAAKGETEVFFWRDLTDNYLEMAKGRLYDPSTDEHHGALYALYQVLLTTIQLLAPFLPYVTEQVYRGLFKDVVGAEFLHSAGWPTPDARLTDSEAESTGETLVEIATAVRRFKSDRSLSLGSQLAALHVASPDAGLLRRLCQAQEDILGVTRAHHLDFAANLPRSAEPTFVTGDVSIGIVLW